MTKRVGHWLWDFFRRSWIVFVMGMFSGWLAMAWRPPVGLEIVSQSEAEGPQFADKSSLEIVYNKRQDQTCFTQGQDWIWRWIKLNGQDVKMRKVLDSSLVPFLDNDAVSILSTEVPPSVDVTLPWLHRRTINEACEILPSWVPSWARAWFISRRMFRTVDLPVNFIGAPHDPR